MRLIAGLVIMFIIYSIAEAIFGRGSGLVAVFVLAGIGWLLSH